MPDAISLCSVTCFSAINRRTPAFFSFVRDARLSLTPSAANRDALFFSRSFAVVSRFRAEIFWSKSRIPYHAAIIPSLTFGHVLIRQTIYQKHLALYKMKTRPRIPPRTGIRRQTMLDGNLPENRKSRFINVGCETCRTMLVFTSQVTEPRPLLEG